jgi:RNA polymerase sigma-70 factor (ECF subfamily)
MGSGEGRVANLPAPSIPRLAISLAVSPKIEGDERALARALIDRGADAVVPAWRLLSPFVERTLRRLLGPDRDREDLVQEVFLRFFRKVPALRDPAALRPFLFGIVARVVKRELRNRWLLRWFTLGGSGTATATAAHPASLTGGAAEIDPLAREAVARLMRVLAAVSAEDRSLFVARYVEEMELADVAAAHGLSFSTARRRLDRAWARVHARALRDPILGSYLSEQREGGARGGRSEGRGRTR